MTQQDSCRIIQRRHLSSLHLLSPRMGVSLTGKLSPTLPHSPAHGGGRDNLHVLLFTVALNEDPGQPLACSASDQAQTP